MTGLRGVGLVVLVADCVPVLLAGRGAGGPVLGVVHAGRKGVQAGVVTVAVDAMGSLGARPERTSALVGPAVCGRCYEVPAALRSEVAATAPTARATSRAGNTRARPPGGGARPSWPRPASGTSRPTRRCSMEETALFSHRRSGGRTGRFAGVVVGPGRRDGTPMSGDARRAEIGANLERVRARIAAACDAAGRARTDVTPAWRSPRPSRRTTWATSPPSACTTWGRTATRTPRPRPPPAGRPESMVSSGTSSGRCSATRRRPSRGYADVVHSVDRLRLVAALDRAAGARRTARHRARAGRPARPTGRRRARRRSAGRRGRGGDRAGRGRAPDLGGVMAVAPLGGEPAAAFARLAEIAARVRADHPVRRRSSRRG